MKNKEKKPKFKENVILYYAIMEKVPVKIGLQTIERDVKKWHRANKDLELGSLMKPIKPKIGKISYKIVDIRYVKERSPVL